MADKDKNIRIEYSNISEGNYSFTDFCITTVYHFLSVIVRYETGGHQPGIDKGIKVKDIG